MGEELFTSPVGASPVPLGELEVLLPSSLAGAPVSREGAGSVGGAAVVVLDEVLGTAGVFCGVGLVVDEPEVGFALVGVTVLLEGRGTPLGSAVVVVAVVFAEFETLAGADPLLEQLASNVATISLEPAKQPKASSER